MTSKRLALAFLGFLLVSGVLPAPAAADISGVTGQVVQDTLPTNLWIGWKEGITAFVFEENQNLVLGSNLTVDLLAPFDWTAPAALAGGTVPAGTVLNSHLVHFDPLGSPSTTKTVTGTVTFSNKILGAIVTTSSLNSTDGLLGPASMTGKYPTGQVYRGLEEGDNVKVTLLNPYTVGFTLKASTALNEFRVLTVPAPAAIGLGLIGLGLVGWLKRRMA